MINHTNLGKPNVYYGGFYAMASRLEMVMPGIDEDRGESIYNIINKEVARIESKISRFIATSNVTELNTNAFRHKVFVDVEMYEILKTCKKFHELTLGAFDITCLSDQLAASAKYEDEGFPEDLLDRVATIDNLILADKDRSVFFSNDKLKIDLGGFGKGYALEKIKALVQNEKIRDAFISFGESSVLAIGDHPYGKGWKTGVKNMLNDSEIVHTFLLKDQSLSTSGNLNTVNKGHILNPGTGKPVSEMKTVSVLSGSALDSELLSTALMVNMSLEQKQEIIRKFAGISVVEIIYEGNNKIVNLLV